MYFYTALQHEFGRTAAEVANAVLFCLLPFALASVLHAASSRGSALRRKQGQHCAILLVNSLQAASGHSLIRHPNSLQRSDASHREQVTMAAQEEATAPRTIFVDTSNEPRTDEEAVSMCTQGLERATAPQDIADLQFRLANAQGRRGFPELAVTAFRASVARIHVV